jgi:hypothetical protein
MNDDNTLAEMAKGLGSRVATSTQDGMTSYMAAEDGKIITGTVQDCTPILEDAKARQNAGMFGTSEMRHAASIPMSVIEQYCNTNGITYEEWSTDRVHLRRMLTDPALSGFRIWTGSTH